MNAITCTRQTRRDYYGILGIAADANTEDIKRAYLKLAFQCHPDRNSESEEAHKRMEEINEAYAVLRDPVKRREYDLTRGYGVRSPKFGKGSKVRIKADSPSQYRGYVGFVDKEPVNDMFRFWYMVRIESVGLSSVRRFAEEELQELKD